MVIHAHNEISFSAPKKKKKMSYQAMKRHGGDFNAYY